MPGWNLAMAIEGIGTAIWMVGTYSMIVVLQFLLLVIHRSAISSPKNGKPSGTELFVGVVLLWVSYFGLIQLIGWVWLGFGDAGYSIRDGIALLFSRMALTWCFHLGLIFLLDTALPFLDELRQSPHQTLQNLDIRLKEILAFLHTAFQDPFSKLSFKKTAPLPQEILKSSKGAIFLERRQTDHPREGQRRLSWNLVVDREALNEMKETLGPPGGFGELGFNVAKDGVRFEAMGVGTSFNLCFRLKDEGEAKTKELKKMRRRHT